MLAHGKVLATKFYSSEQVAAVSRDFSSGRLSDGEVALMDFAKKVATKANEITQSDLDGLRDHGFTDAEILRCDSERNPDRLDTEASLCQGVCFGRGGVSRLAPSW